MLRLSPTGFNRFFQTPVMETTFCGAEANVAVALSMMGKDTRYVTKLPDNDVGKAAQMELRRFGIDTSSISWGGERMGIIYAEKGVSQRPSKVVYDRRYSSVSMAGASDFCWDDIFDGADWFHVTGITPALSEQLAQICIQAVKAAKDRGLTVSCDLNYRGKLWSKEQAGKIMAEIVPYVDVCIGNEEDAYNVFGIKAGNTDVESGELDVSGTEYAARTLSERFGCRYVAFSQRKSFSASDNGWFGALYSADSGKMCFSREYTIRLVDRIGGGDAYAAGLIYALHSGMLQQEAVEFAAASGCLNQTLEGDFSRLTADEISALAGGSASGRIVR